MVDTHRPEGGTAGKSATTPVSRVGDTGARGFTHHMRVRILFFGATADEAGTAEAEVDLEDGIAAEAALTEVLARYPELTASRERGSLLFAVNHQYVKGDEVVRDGDELAVFTAVSGG